MHVNIGIRLLFSLPLVVGLCHQKSINNSALCDCPGSNCYYSPRLKNGLCYCGPCCTQGVCGCPPSTSSCFINPNACANLTSGRCETKGCPNGQHRLTAVADLCTSGYRQHVVISVHSVTKKQTDINRIAILLYLFLIFSELVSILSLWSSCCVRLW